LQVRQRRVESAEKTKIFGSRAAVGAPAHKLAQLRRELARRARKGLEIAVTSVGSRAAHTGRRAARSRCKGQSIQNFYYSSSSPHSSLRRIHLLPQPKLQTSINNPKQLSKTSTQHLYIPKQLYKPSNLLNPTTNPQNFFTKP
jgi:hypothetical protein